MRVALVTGRFPQVSQSFVLQQASGLLGLGVDLEVFASAPPSDTLVDPAFQQHDLDLRTFYRPNIPPAGLGRWVAMAGHVVGFDSQVRRSVAASLARVGAGQISLSPLPGFYLPGLIARGPFDVIHAQFGVYGRHVVSLRRGNPELRLVTTFHGFDANVEPRRLGPDMYTELFEHGDVFTVNSNFLRERLVDLGCPADKIELLPMGVDLEQFPFERREPRQGRPVRLLTVGRLVEAKGMKVAIRAVGHLVESGADVELDIVGDGEERQALEQLVGELGLDGRVHFLGYRTRDTLCEAYLHADLFVLASIRSERGDEETQGLVVQEAQATGLPVVVSDVGGITEGMLHGESGLAVPPGNPEALAAALSRLIAAPEKWAEMGEVGRRQVEERYDLRRLNTRLLEIYRGV